MVSATPHLVEKAVELTSGKGDQGPAGRSVTEDTLLGVRPQDDSVRRWIDAGYVGVDMETSAVFSAAQHMGMSRLSLIHIWDEYALGRRWSDPLPPDVDAYRRSTEEAMFEIALETCL